MARKAERNYRLDLESTLNAWKNRRGKKPSLVAVSVACAALEEERNGPLARTSKRSTRAPMLACA